MKIRLFANGLLAASLLMGGSASTLRATASPPSLAPIEPSAAEPVVAGEIKQSALTPEIQLPVRSDTSTTSLAELEAGGLYRPDAAKSPAAPEQIRGLEADTRTDLFHLGLLLFRMLYGKCYVSSALRPFRHLPAFGALPAPTELSFLADHSLSLVLAGLLAESNSARFESARTLMDALSAAQEHPPAHV
jgi:hypothetical protein